MILLDSLFPIFSLLVLGILLKRMGLTDSVFLKQADRLVYYIFFPIMLFWKIGGASYEGGIDWNFCLAALAVLLIMFVISTLSISYFGISDYQAGSFSQSCYRFNTYIGMAVILNSLGDEGVMYFGILIGLAIPLINLFAVSLLIWYAEEDVHSGKRAAIVFRALVSNPLIIGCLFGIFYARWVQEFPVFIDNSLRLISMVTLPLALISIGGSLTFAGMRDHFKVSLLASTQKLLLLPLIGYLIFKGFDVQEVPFKVGMIFFALPASTAIYVLSSQLNSDTELASSAIVLSTILSFIPLSIVLLM